MARRWCFAHAFSALMLALAVAEGKRTRQTKNGPIHLRESGRWESRVDQADFSTKEACDLGIQHR